jgi:hypothetical protein
LALILAAKRLAAASRRRAVSYFLLHQAILTKNNVSIVSYPPYCSLFPRLKIKLKGRHFDTSEVIEAESQEVLNSPREHEFQDAFKKMSQTPRTVHMRGIGLLRWRWWPLGPKLVFDQMAALVPDIMDRSLYVVNTGPESEPGVTFLKLPLIWPPSIIFDSGLKASSALD